MSDRPLPPIGTVAEEAARLIAAMATMAPSRAVPGDAPTPDPDPYVRPAGVPSGHSSSPGAPSDDPGTAGACSGCGGESEGAPVACRLCPLCQGIALLRSVRPETVDRLADLASAMAASLRDMATQSRASSPASEESSHGGRPSHGACVQEIRVDDADEGRPR